jgi:hypothetical protein
VMFCSIGFLLLHRVVRVASWIWLFLLREEVQLCLWFRCGLGGLLGLDGGLDAGLGDSEVVWLWQDLLKFRVNFIKTAFKPLKLILGVDCC